MFNIFKVQSKSEVQIVTYLIKKLQLGEIFIALVHEAP